MSHSKGPLKISGPSSGKDQYDDGGDYAIVEPGGVIVGEAFRRVGEDATRDAEANARLWAAAPDLLAALEEASDAVAELGDERLAEETGNDDWRGLSARIKNALAGARGEDAGGWPEPPETW